MKAKACGALIAGLLLVGCSGTNGVDGADGVSALVDVSQEAPGANCPQGGLAVRSGPDSDSSGTLDDSEVAQTRYVCNGADGQTVLTRTADEPAGANCANGGVRIDAGIDSDASGTLDDTEVTDTRYVCNGADGQDGQDGQDGVSYLTATTDEPAGANCANGGLRVDSGPDTDHSGTLDPGEISVSSYVCNGVDGKDGQDGANALTQTSDEPAGANCANGGVRIDSGVDSDASGDLQSGEITSTSYVCNGADGQANAPVVVTNYAGLNSEIDTTSGTTATVTSAAITVPAAGTVIALGTADVYCSTTGAPACATSGPSSGFLAVTADANSDPQTAETSYFSLTNDSTESVTRSNVFTVSAAGSYTYYLRTRSLNGTLGYFRGQLTLIYLAN